jgi:hypothetical protein
VEIQDRIEEQKKNILSLFTLADIPVLKVWELDNQYWPRSRGEADPWWLVKTPYGLIEIGPRKRVISIDWSDTEVRCNVTNDGVTKGETYVHAWDLTAALNYLTVLSKELKTSGRKENG